MRTGTEVKRAVVEKASYVAMTVLAKSPDARLSPFFGLAPWLLLHRETSEEPVLVPNEGRTVDDMVDLIRNFAPDLLICGHIPVTAAADLARAGIEVRVGPCSVPAQSLVSRVGTLPVPTLKLVE